MSRLPLRLLLISVLLHAWLAWRLVPPLAPWPAAAAALAITLLAGALLLPAGLRRTADRRTLAGLVALGLFSSLFVLSLLRDVALLLAGLAALAWPALQATPAFEAGSAAAVLLGALLATAWGAWNARRTAAVVDVEVPIAGLPEPLHGFTIAQISDVHVGPTIRADYVEAIVERVNGLGADLVAVTGDLVDGRVEELAEHVAPLARLRSRHGSFFVTGNHEYYSGVHGWIAELDRLGLRVLVNEHVVLAHAQATLVVAGVADHGAHHFDPRHRSDPAAALAGAPADAGLRLLLAHQPRSAPAAAAAGFHLQLSGHTHGGQFWPWNHFVRLQQPFTAGLHRLADLWIYVSRGTGYWGPPKRLGAPSEITRLRLVPAVAELTRGAGP